MKKLTTLLLFLLFAAIHGAFAQKTITGTVSDSGDKLGIAGATVAVKGDADNGTYTDIDGNFSLNVPNDAVIVVSFVGYSPVELPIEDRAQFDIIMKPFAYEDCPVPMTALGIRRRSLPYSLQQVSDDELTKAGDINFVNALNGKISGIEIKKVASGVGGSVRAILRGAKSFSKVSQPLYVIDGIPMINRTGNQAGMWGGYDEGDGLSRINPGDIESISVLKGANAAILYGGQGANGVVMITTKKGTEGTFDISIGSATTFENVLLYPELQYNYGSREIVMENWNKTPLSSYDDRFVKDFFQKGYNLVNNVSISGGVDRITAYLSYANTKVKGVIPENEYQKHNVTANVSLKFFRNKLTIGANAMFADEMTNNRPPNGYYLNPLTGLYWFPRQKNINYYKENYRTFVYSNSPFLQMYAQNWFINDHHQSNPWWIMNMQQRDDGGNRIIAGANADWNIVKGLNFKVRGSYEHAGQKHEQRHAAGSNSSNVSRTGRWDYGKYEDRQSYLDGIITYNSGFSGFSLNAVAGASYQDYLYGDGINFTTGSSAELLFPNEFTFQNLPRGQGVVILSGFSSKGIKKGLFTNLSLGFKDMIFLDLSGRNDRSSIITQTKYEQLAPIPVSPVGIDPMPYFSSSIGLSGIISEMVALPDFVTFGKARGSYAKIASEVPFDAVSHERHSAPYTDVKPERHKSIELGTDWSFWKGRAGFDITYYHITSTDQFLEVPALANSGFARRYVNTGKVVNKGIELTVDVTPVASGSFSWRTALNFARNKNEIVEVDPTDPEIRSALGNSEGYFCYIEAGGSFGDLYTYNFTYDAKGRYLVDKYNKPLRTKEVEYAGSVNHDFTLGWNNTFTYKRLSLDFLINGIFGGVVVSQTESMLDGYGSSKRSGDARDNGQFMDIEAAREDGAAIQLTPQQWYGGIGGRNGILRAYVYDRTNIRFTQFSLNYDIPVKALKLPLKSASVGLTGQNLFFLYIKAPYDPELTMSANNNSQGLDNFNMPSTRTYGFNIRVSF